MVKNGLLHFYLFFFRIIVWKKAGKEIYSLFCSVKNNDARAVFTWMWKVIRIRFGFLFRHSCFVLKHSRHLQLLVQSEVKPTNRDSLTHVFPRFTPITWLLWDLIGSLDCLYLLWLVTLCWFWHWTENFSLHCF